MNPQGSSNVDTAYLESIVKQINEINICKDLQEAVTSALTSLNAQLKALQAQMAFIKPIEELLQNPAAELAKIIEWIGKFITNVLKPMYEPYLTMVQQEVALVKAFTDIGVAAENAAQRIGQCVVTLPVVALQGASDAAAGVNSSGGPTQ